jgi:ABC-type multidrug transport system fused ATPase/permease subunit
MSIWKNKKFVSLVMLHSVFAAVSIFLALAAKVYADQFVGSAIPDLILDHIPRIDTSFFFYQGAFALVAVILVAVYCLPQYIPFILASVASFYLIRSCLMVTTHLPAAYAPSGNDLFFSGHTGLPFLMALVFWRYAILRYFFVFASVVAGISVLLSHVHYTIDVLAAYFITYSIYKICVRIFHIEHGYLRS